MRDFDLPDGFIPKPLWVDDLIQASLNAMCPYVKANLSLLNSILELKDFRSLPKTLNGIANLTSRIKTQIGSAFGKRKALRLLLRQSSDAYLTERFAIAPLLSDMAGIKQALSSTQKRIQSLLDRSEKLQTSHYNRDVGPPEDVTSDVMYTQANIPNPGYTPALNTHRITRRAVEEATKFHAELQYSYYYSEYQRQNAAILGLLDSLGVNLNPAIIWNAIPWSFVVDWFIGVSRWLDNFKLRNLEPVIIIHQYLWSVTKKRTIYVSYGNVSYPNPSHRAIGPTPMPTVVETSYRRDVGLPSVSSITKSGLTLDEFSLGAALAISRKSRARIRRGW